MCKVNADTVPMLMSAGLGLARPRMTVSLGSFGDCYDNALCESFFASLECELIDRFTFRTKQEAHSAVFRWIYSIT